MATTKEQAEAYGYEGRRQATTLVTGQDEARTDPRRRINRVTAAGVLIGGEPDDFLGQYRRNSHGSLVLRYSF